MNAIVLLSVLGTAMSYSGAILSVATLFAAVVLYFAMPFFSRLTAPDLRSLGLIGDADVYEGEYMGDAEEQEYSIGAGDIEEEDLGQGAPKFGKGLKKALKRKVVGSKGTAQPAAAAAKVESSSIVDTIQIQPVMFSNAKIVQKGSNSALKGRFMRLNVERQITAYPYQTITASISGIADGNIFQPAVFNDGAKPEGCGVYAFPVIFITIVASNQNARSGNPYVLRVVGRTVDGNTVSDEIWSFDRINVDKPVGVVYFPYMKVKDTAVSALCGFGDIGGENQNVSFSVEIKGMPVGESARVLLPGVDSEEYKELLKGMNINM